MSALESAPPAVLPFLFDGQLTNTRGEAIPSARLQLWQTDLDGNYDHPSASASLTPSNFQYYGTATTNNNGAFEFLTYRPGIYSGRPWSHFHVKLWLLDADDSSTSASLVPVLTSQFYFRDENPPFPDVLQLDVVETDATLGTDGTYSYAYGSYANKTVVIDFDMDGSGSLPVTPAQVEGPFYPVVDFFDYDNDLTTWVDAPDVGDDGSTDAGDSNSVSPTVSTADVPTPRPSVSAVPSSVDVEGTTEAPATSIGSPSSTGNASRFDRLDRVGLWCALLVFFNAVV